MDGGLGLDTELEEGSGSVVGVSRNPLQGIHDGCHGRRVTRGSGIGDCSTGCDNRLGPPREDCPNVGKVEVDQPVVAHDGPDPGHHVLDRGRPDVGGDDDSRCGDGPDPVDDGSRVLPGGFVVGGQGDDGDSERLPVRQGPEHVERFATGCPERRRHEHHRRCRFDRRHHRGRVSRVGTYPVRVRSQERPSTVGVADDDATLRGLVEPLEFPREPTERDDGDGPVGSIVERGDVAGPGPAHDRPPSRNRFVDPSLKRTAGGQERMRSPIGSMTRIGRNRLK